MLIPPAPIQRYRHMINTHLGAAVVLVYHRIIDDDSPDPEHLGITSSRFASHLAMIARCFPTPHLEMVADAVLTRTTLTPSSVCITFDDGYHDNFTKALPLLERYRIPATFFIATLPFEGVPFAWDRKTDRDPMSRYVDEPTLRESARHPLATIGGHAHTHRVLSDLCFDEAYEDIARNRRILKRICGNEPLLFAYPYGTPQSFNRDSVAAVRESGYRAAFTTVHGTVNTRRDPLRLMRVNPGTTSAKELQAILESYFGSSVKD